MNSDLSIFIDGIDQVYPFESNIVKFNLNEQLENIEILSPINYKGQIYRTFDGFYIELDISYQYKTNCDRCLKSTVSKVERKMSGRLYESEKSNNEGIDEELDMDEYEEPIYYENGYLDLDDYVLMEVASSLPMKTLCSEDCKGLCKKCGINLNKKSCNCDTDFIDPRLAKLKDIVIDD